jgi:hypothetical protein
MVSGNLSPLYHVKLYRKTEAATFLALSKTNFLTTSFHFTFKFTTLQETNIELFLPNQFRTYERKDVKSTVFWVVTSCSTQQPDVSEQRIASILNVESKAM